MFKQVMIFTHYHANSLSLSLRPQEFNDDISPANVEQSHDPDEHSHEQSHDPDEQSCDSDEDIFVNTNRQTNSTLEFTSSDTD